MAVITMGTVVSQTIGDFTIGQMTFEMTETSDVTGASATRVFSPPRWKISMRAMEYLTSDQSAEWETMTLQLRGTVNHLAVWDVSRPAPRGTMRGTLTLSALAAAGATTISVTGGAGQASRTLLKGDWLQLGTGVGSQLVKVMADATSNGSGVISLTIEPPLRVQFASATAVTWDKPVAYYKKTGGTVEWSNYAGTLNYSGFPLDLVEQW